MFATAYNWLGEVPHCYLYGKPALVLLHLVGDLGTCMAYMLIPLAIETVRRMRELPFSWLAASFSAFIFFCGFGHFLGIMVMTQGNGWYWVEGGNKLLTFMVSIYTAWRLFQLVPVFIRIPTPDEHEDVLRANEEARRKVALYEEPIKWTTLVEGMALGPQEVAGAPSPVPAYHSS